MKYVAQEMNGRLGPIIEVKDGDDLATLYHPDYVATLVEVSSMAKEGWVRDGDGFVAPAPAEITRESLIAYLKLRRWQVECAGVTVAIGAEDVLVSTARGEDRAALHQAFSAIVAGLRQDGAAFNFADGKPRQLTNADMQLAVMAALDHVQAAFDLEASLTAEIEAGGLTSFAAIDAAFVAT